MVTTVTLFTLLPYIQGKIEPKKGKKTKVYFQFWASQFLCVGVGFWTIFKNSHQVSDMFTGSMAYYNIPFLIMVVVTLIIHFANIDFNTPTLCVCCGQGVFRIAVTILALAITSFFLLVVLMSIPSILLIYYLYPVQSLARLPFIVNVFLYVNSLTALLFCQFERLIFHIRPKVVENSIMRCSSDLHRKRLQAHKNHYQGYKSTMGYGTITMWLSLVLQPLGTFALLYFLMVYVVGLSDLLNVDRSKFTNKAEVESLFSLVPTTLLLLFSIYNKNYFIKDEESGKKRGLFDDLDLMNVNTVKEEEEDSSDSNVEANVEDSRSAKAKKCTEQTPLMK